ncbi:hypothetical protein LOK49_LG02G01495 [Camellia lanceoleosa]|uniref:Uncharacterized protein n=1 Tax=Camellia lanceoleosa TaxID=1840588 RepID=A0ACC0IRC4_9ERIC|nr:hypothetical protein LOK49_LG02G01495 [Camellia lanceoleosa]
MVEGSTPDFGIGEEDDGEELGDFVRRVGLDDFRMERGRSLRKMVLVVGRGLLREQETTDLRYHCGFLRAMKADEVAKKALDGIKSGSFIVPNFEESYCPLQSGLSSKIIPNGIC